MASFSIKLYDGPLDELSALLGHNPRPRWVEHMLVLRGRTPEEPSTGALLEVLSEAVHRRLVEISLIARKAEMRGWTVRIEGAHALFSSDVSAEATQEALEEDGVWHLVRYLARQGKADVFV